MKKSILAIIWAILRQTLFPYDVYKRDEVGDVIYEKVNLASYHSIGELVAEPVTLPVKSVWATWVARIFSFAMAIMAAWHAGELEVIQRLIDILLGQGE